MRGICKLGVALLFGGAITGSQASASPAVGEQCDNWGEQTSTLTPPMLMCSHGIWKDAFALRQFATVLVIRYANGGVSQQIPLLGQSGTPSLGQKVVQQGNAQFGYGAKLTVTEIGTGGEKVRVEGVLDHWAGAQPITTHIDTVVDLNQNQLIATEPDGTTYTMVVQELRH